MTIKTIILCLLTGVLSFEGGFILGNKSYRNHYCQAHEWKSKFVELENGYYYGYGRPVRYDHWREIETCW